MTTHHTGILNMILGYIDQHKAATLEAVVAAFPNLRRSSLSNALSGAVTRKTLRKVNQCRGSEYVRCEPTKRNGEAKVEWHGQVAGPTWKAQECRRILDEHEAAKLSQDQRNKVVYGRKAAA